MSRSVCVCVECVNEGLSLSRAEHRYHHLVKVSIVAAGCIVMSVEFIMSLFQGLFKGTLQTLPQKTCTMLHVII